MYSEGCSTAVQDQSSTQRERIRAARSAELKPTAKLLLRTLVDFMGKKAHCWPSLKALSEEVGVSVRQIQRLIQELARAGFILIESRHRPNGSQSSNVFRWIWATRDTHVTPPTTSTSSLEHPGEETNKLHAEQSSGCDLNKDAQDKEKPSRSKRYIRIDESRFHKPEHLKAVYEQAVSGRLLNAGSADRNSFCAAWVEIQRKRDAGKVESPARLMRFLLSNRHIMTEYATQSSEQRARAIINHLWPAGP